MVGVSITAAGSVPTLGGWAADNVRLTAKDFDAMSVDDFQAVVSMNPAEQSRIERHLVSTGRTAEVYELARKLAAPPPPERPTPEKPAQKPTDPAQAEAPDAAVPDEVVEEMIEELLVDFAELDALTAGRITEIEHLLMRLRWFGAWNSVMSFFSSANMDFGRIEDLFDIHRADRAEHDEAAAPATYVESGRLIIAKANGDVRSVDLTETDRGEAAPDPGQGGWWRRDDGARAAARREAGVRHAPGTPQNP